MNSISQAGVEARYFALLEPAARSGMPDQIVAHSVEVSNKDIAMEAQTSTVTDRLFCPRRMD